MPSFKLHQVVKLREALQKWRKSASAHRKSRSLSRSNSRRGEASIRVPPGHLAVYVGPERKRFVIKTSLLSHPLFKALLKKAEEEVGYQYEGGLTIPCDVSAFHRLLRLMQGKHAASNMTIMMMRVLGARDLHEEVGEHHSHGFQRLLGELLRLHVTEISSYLGTRCGSRESMLPPVDNGLQQTIYG